MSERINLTLSSDICSKIDDFRGDMFMSRQAFLKYLVCDRLKSLERLRSSEADERLRLTFENRELSDQLDKLKRDFQSVTGRTAKLR